MRPLCALVLLAQLPAAELKPETLRAFESYIAAAESRIAAAPFIRMDKARLRSGEIVVQRVDSKSGTIHDWVGAAFLPGVTVERVLALVEDYNHHKDIYKPEVMDSRLISRNGNDFKIYLRLLKKKVLTVILDTDHDVRYIEIDAKHWASASHTTRVSEVEDGRALPPDTGHGFLWRLNSYWHFAEEDSGTYIECEAISLSRSIPAGLGWLIEPIVRSLPRESLESTLRHTRAALVRAGVGERD